MSSVWFVGYRQTRGQGKAFMIFNFLASLLIKLNMSRNISVEPMNYPEEEQVKNK